MKAEKLCKESGETMTCKDCEKRTSDCHIDCQDYKEQQNEKLFWDSEDNIKKQEYYFATLCSYSPNKLKPYKEYLDKKEQQQQGMDFFSGVGSDTITDNDSVEINGDLSWLNELKV